MRKYSCASDSLRPGQLDNLVSKITDEKKMITEMDKNKQVSDLLGVEDQDWTTDAGTIALLRVLMRREDWDEFQEGYFIGVLDNEKWEWGIPVHFITTPNALLDAVYNWFKGKDEESGKMIGRVTKDTIIIGR